MIIIKSDDEIDLMRISGKVTGYILKELEHFIKPGISDRLSVVNILNSYL